MQAHCGQDEIDAAIARIPPGQPFSIAELRSSGTTAQIYRCLRMLIRTKDIKRVCPRIYVRPKFNPLVGYVPPSIHAVVERIAELTGETIQVTGAEAARRFQLCTQMPVRPIYCTTGPSRAVWISGRLVEFQHKAASEMIWPGRAAGIAVAALSYCGARNLTVNDVRRVLNQLPVSEEAFVIENAHELPSWLRALLQKAKEGGGNEVSR